LPLTLLILNFDAISSAHLSNLALIAFMSTPDELLLTRLRAFLGRLETFGDVVPSVYMPPWALGWAMGAYRGADAGCKEA
jgi:hypothetical protein